VKPYFGIGKRPYDPQFKVLAYQLTTMNCPHLNDNKCNIYDVRPAACRQYPFSLDPDVETGILLGVDMNCPTSVELISKSNSVIEFQDRDSSEKLLELKKYASENARKSWIYDIDSEKWIRYEKLD
jgi:Fe-S-cluster containining protein